MPVEPVISPFDVYIYRNLLAAWAFLQGHGPPRVWVSCRMAPLFNQSIIWMFVKVLWHCWLGVRKSIRPVNNWVWWGVGVVICLERGANDLHMVQLMPLPPIVSCFIKIQTGLTFLSPAYQGCPGEKAVNWVCVKLCAYVHASAYIYRKSAQQNAYAPGCQSAYGRL